nr:MAG TPA: hypothetical protein [Caudoviricetes sp.]
MRNSESRALRFRQPFSESCLTRKLHAALLAVIAAAISSSIIF